MWAESVGQNSWRAGQGIRTITVEEARQFMEAAGRSVEEFIEAGLSIEEA